MSGWGRCGASWAGRAAQTKYGIDPAQHLLHDLAPAGIIWVVSLTAITIDGADQQGSP
jgi:hypothetical protein